MVSSESPRSAAGISLQLDVPPLDIREPALQDVGDDGSGQSVVVNLMYCRRVRWVLEIWLDSATFVSPQVDLRLCDN